MTQRIKYVIGVILALWFFFWSLAFILEPTRQISQITTNLGIHPEHWAVAFMAASFMVFLHLVFNWKWNIIILLPYIAHTSALVFYKIDDNFAPAESVILRLTLLGLLLIEVYVDWRLRWK